MKRLLFVLVAAGLLAPAALAKGPSEASISGPGLGKSLSLKGSGEESGTPLGSLTEYTGFFPAAFGQIPDPMLPGRPPGKLGAKYTIRYVVPGPDGQTFRIRQELYPYARGGAVTYMKPGQRIFDMRTHGGWYRGASELKQTLVRAGLPRKQPRSSNRNLAVLLGIGAPGAALLAGAAVLIARRRSSG
jgi:hypothetical protein